jgi:hypothetical protein
VGKPLIFFSLKLIKGIKKDESWQREAESEKFLRKCPFSSLRFIFSQKTS